MGTGAGQSNFLLSKACEETGGHLYSIDIKDLSHVVSSSVCTFIQSDDTNIDYILNEYPELRKGINFLHIDSLHTKEHIIKQLTRWYPYIKQNAYITFHDVDNHPYTKGQRKENPGIAMDHAEMTEGIQEFFYANEDELFLEFHFGSTGMGFMKKVSPFGRKPRYPAEKRGGLFKTMLYVVKRKIFDKIICGIISRWRRRNNKIKVHGNYKTSVFRTYQNLYLKNFFRSKAYEKILNVGALPQETDKEKSCYEAYFPAADFFTLNLEDTPTNEKHIQADLMDLSHIDQQFDLVLMMSVLEHVKNPFKVSEELKHITDVGSEIYIAVPFFYPLHMGRETRDYWRFTPDSIETLFDYCSVEQIEYYPSVIKAVTDRDRWWNDGRTTFTGFSMLLRRIK